MPSSIMGIIQYESEKQICWKGGENANAVMPISTKQDSRCKPRLTTMLSLAYNAARLVSPARLGQLLQNSVQQYCLSSFSPSDPSNSMF